MSWVGGLSPRRTYPSPAYILVLKGAKIPLFMFLVRRCSCTVVKDNCFRVSADSNPLSCWSSRFRRSFTFGLLVLFAASRIKASCSDDGVGIWPVSRVDCVVVGFGSSGGFSGVSCGW